jgi:dipeptidyl aminopeptidase/acylaminoacyl peptidase
MPTTRTRKKRRIAAEDLYAAELIAECRMAPDGESVIYTQQWVDKATEKKHQNLWLASASGRPAPRRFTWGKQSDGHPRFAPDGKSIAFLSKRSGDEHAQIYRIPIDGGEAQPVTALEGTIGGFKWSPDGKAFAITFRAVDAEVRERKKDSKKKDLGVVERHITRTFFKMDGAGYTPKERWQIHVVNAKTSSRTSTTCT